MPNGVKLNWPLPWQTRPVQVPKNNVWNALCLRHAFQLYYGHFLRNYGFRLFMISRWETTYSSWYLPTYLCHTPSQDKRKYPVRLLWVIQWLFCIFFVKSLFLTISDYTWHLFQWCTIRNGYILKRVYVTQLIIYRANFSVKSEPI